MSTRTIPHALRTPPFRDSEFTPTECSTSADKAWFANHLLHFIAEDFPPTLFTKRFYNRLSMTFGHIAHYNMHGFWGVFFEDLRGKIHFLEQTAAWPCHGDPAFTYCDVERAIARRIAATGLIQRYRAALAEELEQRERQQFDRLKAKYEAVAR
jgi:hypothetical protein